MKGSLQYISLTFLQLWFLPLWSQQSTRPQKNEIFHPNIATVQCHVRGWELSYPFIEFRSSEQVRIAFDFIGSSTPDLEYRIQHCEADWKPSNLLPIEYIEGFADGSIETDYADRTTQDYSHHEFLFPPEDTKLLISGNYLVKVVYASSEEVVFQRRVCVTEQKIAIRANVHEPTILEYRDEYQEVDVSLDLMDMQVLDPFSELKLVILQNGDWNNSIEDLSPRFVNRNVIDYDYDEENLFKGINEFRKFSIKNYGIQSPEILQISLRPEKNFVTLAAGEDLQFKMYRKESDLNGKFYIARDDADMPNIEADYAQVTFNLKHEPVLDGYICIYGQLTDWKCNKDQQLQYDYDKELYTGEVFLKQGFYDYRYAVKRDYEDAPDFSYFAGSHWDTENDYCIFVYYRDKIAGHDRLLSYRLVNSVKK